MLALVVTLLAVVVLFGALVAGLLRSHADILRALHGLGAGVGDPSAPARPAPSGTRPPPLPAERSAGVHDLDGVTPDGDAVVVAMSSSPVTLLAFLTAGCSSCAVLWDGLSDPAQRRAFPAGTRFVAVTRGPEWETPAAVMSHAPRDLTVVMSTQAWTDYEIPGSPYVVLVDGAGGARLGEGVGRGLAEIAAMVGQAAADAGPAASSGRPAALGLDGAEREAHNDAALRAAGILPGDPSLYPRSLDDVFPSR